MTNYDKDTKVMDRKEKHVMESGSVAQRETRLSISTQTGLQKACLQTVADANVRATRKTNRLWLRLGVLTLIFILLYWLFSIGIFEDLIGYFNG